MGKTLLVGDVGVISVVVVAVLLKQRENLCRSKVKIGADDFKRADDQKDEVEDEENV